MRMTSKIGLGGYIIGGVTLASNTCKFLVINRPRVVVVKHRKFMHQVGIPVGLPFALSILTMHWSLVVRVHHLSDMLAYRHLPSTLVHQLLGTMVCHPQCMLI